MSTVVANKWENPDGTENYKCRAWVNFDGTGTVAIQADGNVDSITDNGTGDYTVNFTIDMSDSNYSVLVNGSRTDANVTSVYDSTTLAAGSVDVYFRTPSNQNQYDPPSVSVVIFR